jgi:threonine/homoserine efflux transporter RhtA
MTRRGIILFAALGLIWGIPYLFIKIAVVELSPEFLVLSRAALAAVILLPLAAYRRALAPVLRRWKPLLAFALIEIAVPWYFLSSAETTLPSSTTGLLLSAVPLAAVQQARLSRTLEAAEGRPVRLILKSDPGLLGGLLHRAHTASQRLWSEVGVQDDVVIKPPAQP